ncbi:MAG: hypothetical protein LBO66_12465 [Deltaproteobacteria bacterium]|jgi:hypothetical protein|nr:hypothetical protein [Deltaproteobacteria bacterium]
MALKAFEKKQKDNLIYLERLARDLGVKVFTGKLFFSGIKLRSGQCLLREVPWLIIDRYNSYEEKIELFRQAFTALPVDPVDFPPLAQQLLFNSAKGAPSRAPASPETF